MFLELLTDDKGTLCDFIKQNLDNDSAHISTRKKGEFYELCLNTTAEPPTPIT